MTVRRRKADVRDVAEIGSKQEESKPHPIYSVVRDRSQDLLQIKLSALGFQLSV